MATVSSLLSSCLSSLLTRKSNCRLPETVIQHPSYISQPCRITCLVSQPAHPAYLLFHPLNLPRCLYEAIFTSRLLLRLSPFVPVPKHLHDDNTVCVTSNDLETGHSSDRGLRIYTLHNRTISSHSDHEAYLSVVYAGNGYGNMQTGLSSHTMLPNQMYHQLPGPNIHQEHTSAAIDNLTDHFGNINFRNAALQGQGKPANTPYPMNEPTMNTGMGQQSAGPMLIQLQDGTFVPAQYQQYANQYNMAMAPAPQYQQAVYQSMSSAGMPHTPRNNSWMPSQGIQQLPDLVAPRRSSWSSNEEASPMTPHERYQPTVLISSHSPTTWNTTPSPIQSQFPYNQQIAKDSDGVPVYADFWAWTQQEPSIPPPVPAVHSGPDGGRGSLDKILDNRNGTTNVYIRGLQPNTTDEMLESYGRRFGPIVSQKAIVEMSNPNLCKG